MQNIIGKNFIQEFNISNKKYYIFSIKKFCEHQSINLKKLPYFIRIMIEMVLRNVPDNKNFSNYIQTLLNNDITDPRSIIPFYPGRVLLQDYTGIPLLADLAAMREYIKKQGADPLIVNPVLPTALVVDHSVIAEFTGNLAVEQNMKKEFERNEERYKFIKWGAKAFKNLEVIPPGNGIVHQVNLEYLAPGVISNGDFLYSDSVIGTDSHTTMTNAISSVGWGVGGIEAETAMLGQPIFMNLPKINGVRFVNKLKKGVTATDIALTVTNELRNIGVTGEIVEFFGKEVKELSVADRATIANMAPEYGALMGFFSIDEKTLEYFKTTGRSEEKIKLIEEYHKTQQLFKIDHELIEYNRIIEIDLSKIDICVSGPRRPEDKLLLSEIKTNFDDYKNLLITKEKKHELKNPINLKNGDITIAAITSCTNTANPSLILTAALIAKNAVKKGLSCPNHVFKIFAPGSKVVGEYLRESGLLQYMEKLGFNITAYGCAACVGNIGNLDKKIEDAIKKDKLIVASVLSGNRNFDARIHHLVRANYLMSPPMVVAFALAGNIYFNIEHDPLGYDANSNPIYLQDIWPKQSELDDFNSFITSSNYYKKNYSITELSNKFWENLNSTNESLYRWNNNSTYIKLPPFLSEDNIQKNSNININKARALLVLGNSITTDHISPAGKILSNSSAAKYLDYKNEKFYNTFGARRGNHEVMLLGAFSNPGVKNLLVQKNGPYSIHFPSKIEGKLEEIANKYKSENTPTLILAGKNYGSGSSRDFASKVTKLLGVKVVIAKSFERIHRSNLIYMGVLPCQFVNEDEIIEDFTGNVYFHLRTTTTTIIPTMNMTLEIIDATNNSLLKSVPVITRLDNDFEVLCYSKGGILPLATEQLMVN